MTAREKTEFTVMGASSIDFESSHGDVGDAANITSHWVPGYRARFPYIGASALLGMLCCMSIITAVLVASDGTSSTHWPQKFGPSIIINGFTSISSLCLALATAEGVAIAW